MKINSTDLKIFIPKINLNLSLCTYISKEKLDSISFYQFLSAADLREGPRGHPTPSCLGKKRKKQKKEKPAG